LNNNISAYLAFLAGILSFLSPCVLPLVPAYISYLTGSRIADLNNGKSKLNTLYKSFGFVIGFSIVFIIMGASVSSISKLFVTHQVIFRKLGGILIIFFGIHTTGLLKFKFLYREKRLLPFDEVGSKFGSVFMGMAFAAGWTPCIGPILSTILIYAGSMDTIVKGIMLLVIYSLGLAIPFIITALAINTFTDHMKIITRHMNVISIISGLLMIIMGIIIFTNKINVLSSYLNFINF
jgi:cytochrome c-type biogenesis protein